MIAILPSGISDRCSLVEFAGLEWQLQYVQLLQAYFLQRLVLPHNSQVAYASTQHGDTVSTDEVNCEKIIRYVSNSSAYQSICFK